MRLQKYSFFQPEVPYLGHVVGADGIKVDPKKTQAVQDWPEPKNVPELRSFLGLATYFRKFIQGFANLTMPLTALLKKEVPWKWSQKCIDAFAGIKHALTHAPMLQIPDHGKPFEVVCDASGYGLGAVLIQDGLPVAYESRKMLPAERNYPGGEQELLAVIHALTVWRCYLEGVKCTVVTDHSPNTFLQSKAPEKLSGRQVRWVQFLQRFDMEWVFRPGRNNVADPLSRDPTFLQVVITRGQAARFRPENNASSAAITPRDQSAHTRLPSISSQEEGGADSHVEQSVLSESLDGIQPGAATAQVGERSLLEGIIEGYASDPWFYDAEAKGLRLKAGICYHQNVVFVPNVAWIRQAILHEAHDAPYSGHLGRDKTFSQLERLFWWPGMRSDAAKYVQRCGTCQRVKGQHIKPAGLLQPLPIPEGRWDSVSMDFIVQLPPTKLGHDAILVFVDRLTKMVHFAPTTGSGLDSERTARLFKHHVFRLHGVPKSIISDRGKQFTSEFSVALYKMLGTQQVFSTAFHPQTDGQTEQVNRVLEDMLRAYVGHVHDDWDEHLDEAEFAVNNAKHASTGESPFMLNYGGDPRTPLMTGLDVELCRVPKAKDFAGALHDKLQDTKRCLAAAQSRQKAWADTHRSAKEFKPGDYVFLNTKNLQPKGGMSKKLLPKYWGPFKVLRKFGEVAYELELPSRWRIHDTFHVSLLKEYHDDGKYHPPPPIELEGEMEYEVEDILHHRVVKVGKNRTKIEFFVKWLGEGYGACTYEPESHLENSPEILADYWRRVRQGQVSVPADTQEGSANSSKRDIQARSQKATGRIPSKIGKHKGVTRGKLRKRRRLG